MRKKQKDFTKDIISHSNIEFISCDIYSSKSVDALGVKMWSTAKKFSLCILHGIIRDPLDGIDVSTDFVWLDGIQFQLELIIAENENEHFEGIQYINAAIAHPMISGTDVTYFKINSMASNEFTSEFLLSKLKMKAYRFFEQCRKAYNEELISYVQEPESYQQEYPYTNMVPNSTLEDPDEPSNILPFRPRTLNMQAAGSDVLVETFYDKHDIFIIRGVAIVVALFLTIQFLLYFLH